MDPLADREPDFFELAERLETTLLDRDFLECCDAGDPERGLPECCVPLDLFDSAECDLDLLLLLERLEAALGDLDLLRDRFEAGEVAFDLLPISGELERDLSKP